MATVYTYDLKEVIDFDKISDSDYLGSKQIKSKEYTIPNVDVEKNIASVFNIYNYDKDCMTHDMRNTTGLFRSLIMTEGKIVAYAPAKSLVFDTFVKRNPNCENVIIEEFVEGTMINLFYHEKNISDDGDIMSIGNWEIATKTTVGGKSVFFKENDKSDEKGFSFRKMFLEAMNEVGLEFSMLDKKYCYSFVVQHPKNRIVSIINKPS